MKENSPKRWKMYQNAPETHQARLRGLIYAAWKNLDRIKNDDKDLYALRLRRLPVEDDIFGISAEIKRGGERASPELRKQLEAKVGEFVDLRHEERKLRIAKLEKTLAAERRELVEFDSRREKIVENRTREVEREGPSALTAEHMARRNDEEQPRSNGDASSTDAAPNDAANDATHNAQNAPRQLEKR
jgi:hypothetical protein